MQNYIIIKKVQPLLLEINADNKNECNIFSNQIHCANGAYCFINNSIALLNPFCTG